MTMRTISLSCIAGLSLLMAGCAPFQPAHDHEQHYILDALPGKAPSSRERLVVRLPAVEVAQYLQGEEMAVRSNGNEVDYPLNHRWAEPLDAGMRRVLSEELRAAPLVEQVLIDEPSPPERTVYRVSVRLLACEGMKNGGGGGEARFSAAWEITKDGSPESVVAHGVFQPPPAPWAADNYNQLASDLSRAARGLTDVILDALAHQGR